MSYEEYKFSFSNTSLSHLETVHPDLQTFAWAVLRYHDLKVSEGHRGQIQQDGHFEAGRSKVKWPNGKHNQSPSDAVHFLPYSEGEFVGWEGVEGMHSWYLFCGLAIGIAQSLYESGQISRQIRWGGDWDSDWNLKESDFRDLAHWELEG